MAVGKKKLEEWVTKNYVTHFNYQENMKPYIEQSHCVILPSYMEGLPRSLMESAAMSRPIITTNTVGCKEVVSDKINGFLCNAKDSKDLADTITMMMQKDYNFLKSIGFEGRKNVLKRFDVDKMCQTTFTEYKKLIELS